MRIAAKLAMNVGLLALVTGCLRTAFLRVAVGSTADHLVFTMSTEAANLKPLRMFGGIKVVQVDCASRERGTGTTYWFITADDGGAIRPSPTKLNYGEDLPGFAVITAPRRLAVGCYNATLLSPGYWAITRFRVDSAAHVQEFPHNATSN